jgi:hypothetical protein
VGPAGALVAKGLADLTRGSVDLVGVRGAELGRARAELGEVALVIGATADETGLLGSEKRERMPAKPNRKIPG